MKALRTAVIGVGHLGRHHARLLAAMPGATLVAAVDPVLERARTAVEHTNARAVADASEIAADIDAAIVAVPTQDHLRVTAPLLERGVHVLVEKPMAGSLDDADEMIRIASKSGAVLAVGHTERFNPAVKTALTVLQTPRFIEVHRLSGFPERSLDIDVVFDVMIHDLDIILAVNKTDVVLVEAIGVNVLTDRIDIANARIKFASGCIANLTASRISRDKVRKLRCFQRDMYVSVDYAEQELEVWQLRSRPGERPAIEGGPIKIDRDEPLRCELQDFVESIQAGRAPGVTGADGRRALALATAVATAIGENGAQA